MPALRELAAVPPVETISTPSSSRPRANSTIPSFSDTDSSARRTRTSPGAARSIPAGLAGPDVAFGEHSEPP